ncbi:uncharacterized protein LOC103840475 isoform X2 [Brassica rapa]|uniref:uncharacterized protein LOC103840475 isoform X2 n=1 Tax=Brassica campestris TaxID=3711 RepID=UPI0004F19F6A|nr:uncharacterized protein LOC103840475 isoform X2 [Brassica rapa]
MPPGAKKRKALKKKQQQESIGTNTNDKGSNGDNLHGNDEHGSQDARESDSTLSSPGSQGNDEFGVTKDPSAEATSSGFVVKESAKEISDVEIGTDDKNNVVEKPPTSSNENSTETSSINVALQDPCVKEIAPVVDSVSKVVISETSEHAETSTHSHLVKQKSDGTSREVETVRESEAPVSSEEKRLLLPGPQAVRTSWLSCCGLFDAMTGSDR